MRTRYYIIDASETEEFQTVEDFFESMEYNYGIAVEYGDDIDDFDDIVNAFNENEEYSEEINGWVFAKLTKTSIDDLDRY